MKTILNFRDFVLESSDQPSGSMTLEQAIDLAQTGRAPNNFMEFLRSPLAAKLSEGQFEIVSTPRQIKNGTFLFSMKGSTSNRAIGLFGNGYIRTVPYGPNATGKAHVLAGPKDVSHIGGSGLSGIKTSMDPVERIKKESAKKNAMKDVYSLLSRFIELKMDFEASPDEFPKFKKGLSVDELPRITIVDTSGNDIGTFPAKSVEFITRERNVAYGLIQAEEVKIKGQNIKNMFIDPKTVDSITLNISRSKIEDANMMPNNSIRLDMNGSSMEDCVVKKAPDSDSMDCYLNLVKSSIVNCSVETNAHTTINMENSIVDGFTVAGNDSGLIAKNSDIRSMEMISGPNVAGLHESLFLNLDNCSVKGLHIDENIVPRLFRMNNIDLKLRHIKIADSKSLEDIVLKAMNKGQAFVTTGDWTLDSDQTRRGLDYEIYKCDFEGVDLSGFDPKNWNDLKILYDFVMLNKNMNLPGDILEKTKRIVKTRGLFNR